MKIQSTRLTIKRAKNFPHIEATENDILITDVESTYLDDMLKEALFKLHNLAIETMQTAVIDNSFHVRFYKATSNCMVYMLTVGQYFSHGIVGEINDLVRVQDPNYVDKILTYPAFKPFTNDPYLGTPVMQFKEGLEIHIAQGRYPDPLDKCREQHHLLIQGHNPERWYKYRGHNHFLIKDHEIIEAYRLSEPGSRLLEKAHVETLEDGVYRVEGGLIVKCDYTLEQLMS